MPSNTLIDNVDDIKIEYVQPKNEYIDELHINSGQIVTETELRSAGINFDTEINIGEETKPQITNYFSSNESANNQLSLLSHYKCNQCCATFTTAQRFNRHMRVHVDSRACICDYCSRSYTRHNIERHIKTVHVNEGRKFYECYVCGAKYKKLVYLQHHLNLHYGIVLVKKGRRTHTKETETQTKEKVYECADTECRYVTANRGSFKKHLQIHTGQASQPSINECKICQKTFSTDRNYRRHVQGHSKPFKCATCPKAFTEKYKLNKHVASHSSIDHNCPICDRQVKRSRLKRHMRIHVTEKIFKCEKCPKAFSLQLNLNKHKLRHVIGDKYQCYMCTFSSKRLSNLKFHFSKHTGKKVFKCKICFRTFLGEDDCRKHVSRHTSGTYTCDVCSATFSYAENLKRHMVKHKNKNSFACTVCPRSYSYRSSLDKHIRAVHNAEKHKCQVCLKMFSEKCNLKRHIQNVHIADNANGIKYRCTNCTYVTHNKNNLKSHSKWHNTERPHACAECPKTFQMRSGLSKHMKGCHSKQPKIYTCNICQETFNDRSSRLKHKRVHIEKPIFKCNICSIQRKSAYHLKFHMNVHTQPYQCRTCLKRFSTKPNLARHQKTHGLRADGLPDSRIKYECYICGHSARQGIDTLKIHFSKHTGEKLFKCNICSRAFSRPDYLKLHLRIHTGEKPFKCDKCSLQFAQKSALRSHIKLHDKYNRKRAEKLLPSSKRKYECWRCEFSTSDLTNLIRHSRSHGIELNSFVKLNKLPVGH